MTTSVDWDAKPQIKQTEIVVNGKERTTLMLPPHPLVCADRFS